MSSDRNSVFAQFSPELLEACVTALLSQVNILRISLSLSPLDISDLLRNIQAAKDTAPAFDWKEENERIT